MNSSIPQQVTVLFDEFATPTFRTDRESDYFLGVGVVYPSEVEDDLFKQADELFGLSNRNPLKNSRIAVPRADNISQLVSELPAQVTVSSLDLSNGDLQRSTKTYEELGNELRKLHRRVRERPVAQILHSNILDDTLFESIARYLELNQMDTDFDVYIDDWAFPARDVEIALVHRSDSLRQKINDVQSRFGLATALSISPIQLLNVDSKRKRFIDVVTSAVSRSFLPREHPHYSPVPLQNILALADNRQVDFTKHTIIFLQRAMDEFSRNPGPLA